MSPSRAMIRLTTSLESAGDLVVLGSERPVMLKCEAANALQCYNVPPFELLPELDGEPIEEDDVSPQRIIRVQCRLANTLRHLRGDLIYRESRTCMLRPLTDLTLKPYSVTKSPRGSQTSAERNRRRRGCRSRRSRPNEAHLAPASRMVCILRYPREIQ